MIQVTGRLMGLPWLQLRRKLMWGVFNLMGSLMLMIFSAFTDVVKTRGIRGG